MIPEVLGDIFETPPETTVFAHQANCMNTLAEGISLGIAGIIGQRYPEASAADAKTTKGDKSKLGTFSLARCEDGRIIANVYSQYHYKGARPTSYDAVVTGLEALREHASASLAAYKLPAAIAIVGSYPRNANQKVDRRALEVIVAEHLSG